MQNVLGCTHARLYLYIWYIVYVVVAGAGVGDGAADGGPLTGVAGGAAVVTLGGDGVASLLVVAGGTLCEVDPVGGATEKTCKKHVNHFELLPENFAKNLYSH